MALEQTVDKMEVAGPTASGADGEGARQVRFGAGGEGGGLLVPGVDPFDRSVGAQRVGDAVERIPGDAVNPADAGGLEGFDKKVGDIS